MCRGHRLILTPSIHFGFGIQALLSPVPKVVTAQLNNLEGGDEAEESQETSRGAEVGLVGGAGVSRSGGRASGAGASAGRDTGASGDTATVRGRRAGAVGGRVVGGARWRWERDRGGLHRGGLSRGSGLRDVRSAGDDSRAGRLGDGATTGAVGDGQGGGLADGVSLTLVGDLGGLRAVGGVGSHNVRDVHVGGGGSHSGVAHVSGGGGTSKASGSDSSSETHVDGIKDKLGLSWCWSIKVLQVLRV